MSFQLEHLTIGHGERILIEDLSWTFADSSITAITGPSGSGKSSLFSVIAGFGEPVAGKVTFDGAAQQDIALVSQMPVSLSHRSVRDNVAIGSLARGASYADACHTADVLLADLGIESLAETPAHRTSGGERQRVAIARMIARESSILLADEPTASLDSRSRAAVVLALQLAAQRGATVLIATHDEVVAQACDARLAPWST